MGRGSELVEAAVRPTATDLIEARALVVDALAEGSVVSLGQLEQQFLDARGVPPQQYREAVSVQGQHGSVTAIDDAHPWLLRQRLRFALREVMTSLAAEGAIVRVSGGEAPSEESMPASGPGWGGGVRFTHDHAIGPNGGRFRLAVTSSPRMQLAREDLATELADLLGARGAEVLAEATRAFHRGLFIAAVDLLAAASEAAWFTLASLVVDDAKLGPALDDRMGAADVIVRTVEGVRRAKAADRHALTDLHAQAARLRDLRNYGLHPVGEHDEDREAAFTEAGAAALFMTAPRYFRQLDRVRVNLADSR